MNIVRSGRGVDVTVIPEKGSDIVQDFQGKDVTLVVFNSNEVLDVAIGDYISIDGKQYTLNNPVEITKTGTNRFRYKCTFEAYFYELNKANMLDAASERSDFQLIGDAGTHLALLITNAQRINGSWTAGTTPGGLNDLTIDYSELNCLQALQKMAVEFDLEYEFSGYTINLVASTGVDNSVSLIYKSGTRGITRSLVSSENFITVLYGYGSEKNLPGDYRGGLTRLIFDDGGAQLGAVISANEATYGRIEGSIIFEDIYPRLKAAITDVSFLDIIFESTDIGFDINDYLLPGEVPKVVFITGALAGYTFDIHEYNHADHTIILVYLKEGGMILPTATAKPAIGDEFVLIDVDMDSATYIATAEAELQAATTAALAKMDSPRVKFVINPDWPYFRTNTLTLVIGEFITVTDTDLGVDYKTRIIALKRSLTNEWVYRLELSDFLLQKIGDDIVRVVMRDRVIKSGYDLKAGTVNNVNIDYYSKVEVDSKVGALGNDTNEPNGFIDRTQVTLAFNDGTRTLSITPVGDSFDIYSQSKKFTFYAAESLAITDTEGEWTFYFDADGVLQATQVWDDDIILKYCIAATVYWDATNKEIIYFGNERHGIQMDGATHEYLHETEGLRFVPPGLGMIDLVVDGNGSLDTHAQVGYEAGEVFDEDLPTQIATQAAPATMDFLYLDGVNWRRRAAQTFISITDGATALHNLIVAGSGSLVATTNGKYLLTHVFANNDESGKMICMPGQVEYANVNAARLGAKTEILDLYTVGMPFAEFKAIATFILQTKTTYANGVKSRIVSTDEGDDYIDWRFEKFSAGSGSGGVSNSHSALTNLTADDHLQYALLEGRIGGQELNGGTADTDALTLVPTATADPLAAGAAVMIMTGGASSEQLVGFDAYTKNTIFGTGSALATLHLNQGFGSSNGLAFGDGDTGIYESSDDVLVFGTPSGGEFQWHINSIEEMGLDANGLAIITIGNATGNFLTAPSGGGLVTQRTPAQVLGDIGAAAAFSGTAGTIVKFTGTGTTLGDSIMSESGTVISVANSVDIAEAGQYLQDGNNVIHIAKHGEAGYYSTIGGAGTRVVTLLRQTVYGYQAGAGASTGYYQTATGYYSGYQNTGLSQTATGYYSGQSNTGSHQTATGMYSGRSNTGSGQTAAGYYSGYQNTGLSQTATGYYSGHQNTGYYQTATGYSSGNSNTGSHQTATGMYSGYYNTGLNQTVTGYASGYLNEGDRVSGFGYEATRENIADDCIGIGYQALKLNSTANQFVVHQANLNATPIIQGDLSSLALVFGGTVTITDIPALATASTKVLIGDGVTNKVQSRTLAEFVEDLGVDSLHIDSTPDTDTTVEGVTTTLTAGELLAFGDVVYVKSDGKVWKADASAYSSSCARYMATEAIAADAAGTFLILGFARDDSWAWTVGAKLFLSETAGDMTETVPATSGAVVQYIGVALTADVVDFRPEMANAEVS